MHFWNIVMLFLHFRIFQFRRLVWARCLANAPYKRCIAEVPREQLTFAGLKRSVVNTKLTLTALNPRVGATVFFPLVNVKLSLSHSNLTVGNAKATFSKNKIQAWWGRWCGENCFAFANTKLFFTNANFAFFSMNVNVTVFLFTCKNHIRKCKITFPKCINSITFIQANLMKLDIGLGTAFCDLRMRQLQKLNGNVLFFDCAPQDCCQCINVFW
jgi:hypothetical protein